MQLAGLFNLFILFSSLISVVWGDIKVKVHDKVRVFVAANVAWTRDDGDPKQFVLQKVLLGAPINKTDSIPVDSNGENKGELQVEFSFKGKHILQAMPLSGDGNGNLSVLATSDPFDVHGPGSDDFSDNSPEGGAHSATGFSTSTPSPSQLSATTTLATPPPSNTGTTISLPSSSGVVSSAVSGDLASAASRTPIIIGSVIGAAVGLLVMIILILVFIRRRERRRHPTFTEARVVSGLDPESFDSDFRIAPYEFSKSYNEVKAPPYSNYTTSEYVDDRKESFRFPDFDEPAPTLRFVPLTDRQMELEERIHEWQSKLIGADYPTMRNVKAKIESLKQLQGSDWAREVTDEVPPGLL